MSEPKKQEPINAYLTLGEIAVVLGVAQRTVNKYADADRFETSNAIGSDRRAWVSDVREAISNHASEISNHQSEIPSIP